MIQICVPTQRAVTFVPSPTPTYLRFQNSLFTWRPHLAATEFKLSTKDRSSEICSSGVQLVPVVVYEPVPTALCFRDCLLLYGKSKKYISHQYVNRLFVVRRFEICFLKQMLGSFPNGHCDLKGQEFLYLTDTCLFQNMKPNQRVFC